MSSSVDSLNKLSLIGFFSGVGVSVCAFDTNDCICNSTSFSSTFSPSLSGSRRSTWISLASTRIGVIVLDCQVNSPNICSNVR